MPIAAVTRSWIMFAPLIPSIIVIIADLYYFLHTKARRTALNNHVIILLLFCCLIEQVTDIAWQIHVYRTGTVLIEAPVYCLIWTFFAGAAYTSVNTVMTWASIERHILIFHSRWFGSAKKRLFFHYVPLALTILWPVLFYSIVLFGLPCRVPLNYRRRFCSMYGCVSVEYRAAALIDSIVNFVSTAFVAAIMSVSLLIRVIYQKYRMRQRIEWRNYRKLAIQLLPLSFLFIVLQVPPMILYAGYSAGMSPSIGSNYYSDGLFFTYWITQFTPFVVAASIPEWQTKLRNILLLWQRQHIVVPVTTGTSLPKGGGTSAR